MKLITVSDEGLTFMLTRTELQKIVDNLRDINELNYMGIKNMEPDDPDTIACEQELTYMVNFTDALNNILLSLPPH